MSQADASFTQLKINGADRTVEADPATPLLAVLRGELGLTATHFGCGLRQCGACNVLIDGHAVAACDTPLWAAAGKNQPTVPAAPNRPCAVDERPTGELAATTA
jgi:aerobic-type carbon monoxide dehydrogenase small subunit (CoxS/CutS family)